MLLGLAKIRYSNCCVYSSADKDLKHLRFADESACIGPAQPLNSYLNIPAILSAAELTEVNAIYPGYGFLAEDADFAEKCEKSGFKFIGPSAEIIRQMETKLLLNILQNQQAFKQCLVTRKISLRMKIL